jgi:hypothetical protein
METVQPKMQPASNTGSGNTFPETHVLIQNGPDTHLRVTLNNEISGVVEVEFHELYETPFRYPFNML